MALTLVPKYVRALAEQLNATYRVLKGVDPDSVFLRLNGGGSFQVRHSGTNAAVFTVNDGGIAGSISGGNIQNESITSAQIQNGAIDTVDLKDGSVTSVKIADQAIMDADINTGASIAVAKLADLGANNVLRSNGAGNVAGKVVNADIAPAGTANIALNKLAAVPANQILKDAGSGVVGGGLLVDANVAAAGTANIAVNKLADLGANNVLRSSGAGNVAGKIVSGDIADGTIMDVDINAAANIDGAKLLNNSVPSSKLSGGIPPPINTIDSTHIIDGSIALADMAAGVVGLSRVGDVVGDGVSGFMEITGIPATFRSLLVVYTGRSTVAGTAAFVALTFEATPTAGAYFYERTYSTAATTAGQENVGTTASIFAGTVPGASSTAGMRSSGTVTLPDYASTSGHKTVLLQAASMANNVSGSLQNDVVGGLWASTTALARVRLTLSGGAWTTASRLTVYGLST